MACECLTLEIGLVFAKYYKYSSRSSRVAGGNDKSGCASRFAIPRSTGGCVEVPPSGIGLLAW